MKLEKQLEFDFIEQMKRETEVERETREAEFDKGIRRIAYCLIAGMAISGAALAYALIQDLYH